jgi:hypothetical protein
MACLIVRLSEAGDGANFTKTTWKAVAEEVNKGMTKGAPKTPASCKSKYQKVHNWKPHTQSGYILLRQLKKLYLIVWAIIANSGWTWDDVKGTCIGPDNAGSWDAWVAVNSLSAPFRNAGWIHLESFRTLMPNAVARSAHVFRATTAVVELSLILDVDSQPIEWPASDEQPPAANDKDENNDFSDDSDKENEPEVRTNFLFRLYLW